MSEDQLNKLDVLTAIADIADGILDSATLVETLPQERYMIDGDLIRKLSIALDQLHAIEEQQMANFASSGPSLIISDHEDSSDIIG